MREFATERLLGLFKVAPILSAIFIVAFYSVVPTVTPYFGLDDYVRLLLSRAPNFITGALIILTTIFCIGINSKGKLLKVQQRIARKYFYGAVFGVIILLIFSIVDRVFTIQEKQFPVNTRVFIYIVTQLIFIVLGGPLWLLLQFVFHKTNKPLKIEDYMDSRVDLVLISIMLVPTFLEAHIIYETNKFKSSVIVRDCISDEDNTYIRLFNTSNGILFYKDNNMVFLTYDCLKSVKYKNFYKSVNSK